MNENKYLVKIASTRLLRELAKTPGKFNVKDLTRNGYIRSVDRYAEGIHKGNTLIAHKNNAVIEKVDPLDKETFSKTWDYGGHRFSSLLKRDAAGNISATSKIDHVKPSIFSKMFLPFHSIFSRKSTTNLRHAFGNRHEAHEIREVTKDWVPKSTLAYNSGNAIPTFTGTTSTKGVITGKHANLSVLMRESTDLNKIPHKDLLGKMVKLRGKTGESAILERITGKPYGSVFNQRDIKIGRNVATNSEVNGVKTHAP